MRAKYDKLKSNKCLRIREEKIMNENERRENLINEIVKLLRELPVAVVREVYAVALEHKKNNAGRKTE
jgi:hypothetical protein